MRAVTQGSSLIKIEVVEASSLNSEVLSPWCDDTMWGALLTNVFIRSLTNNKGVNNLGITVHHVLREGEFNSSKLVISRLKVMELNSSNTLSDSAVPAILV